ncbi:MAG TPA: hypothetical protein VK176_11675 [Phycisphaerales bacterium]|nr:hypothetical protein [Phycisphaerales bacterium]
MPALHVIIAPAFLAALTTLELGATHRLVEAAWQSEPAGQLPDEDTFLAAVARITPAEWSAAKPAVLRALGSAPHGTAHDPSCATAGHLVLQAVRSVYHATAANVAQESARAAEISAKRRAAGSAGAAARWQSDGKPMANAIHLPSAAPSLRSSSPALSLAPTLHRSTPQSANQGAQDGDVCAVLGEGARALLELKAQDWRRTKALGMLQTAIAKWAAAGLTNCPVHKAAEMASGEHATPARVEYLIQEADGLIATEKAKGRRCNPVGLVIAGLGQSERSGGRPREVPLFVVSKWAKTESETLRLLEAQAAIQAKTTAARAAVQPTTQTGTSPAFRRS